MPNQPIQLDFAEIADRRDFHRLFHAALNFPPVYGMTIDAWIDCVFDIVNAYEWPAGSRLELEISNAEQVMRRNPDIMREFIEAVATVNHMSSQYHNETRLALIFR
jgi:RNAse (barnase) inhibitor barstar